MREIDERTLELDAQAVLDAARAGLPFNRFETKRKGNMLRVRFPDRVTCDAWKSKIANVNVS